MNIQQLTTARLVLQSITPALIHELFNTKTAEEIKYFFGCDDSRFEGLEQMHLQGMETFRISQHSFLLVDKESNTSVGECGFHTWNKTHRRAELFYFLNNDEQKQKGLMTEALSVVLEFGFTDLDLHRIDAKVADWNTPSIKLLQRYGFTKEGTCREDYCVNGINEDSDCYSLLKWEWEKANAKLKIKN